MTVVMLLEGERRAVDPQQWRSISPAWTKIESSVWIHS